MRIAIVSTPFVAVPPRDYGGTELVVDALVRGLTASGHAVTLFATGDSRGPDLRFLFRKPVWPPDPITEQRHCEAAAHAIARERFDIVHAHAPAMLRTGALGAPLVYTIHHVRDEALSTLYRRRKDVHFVAISHRQAELERGTACHVVHHGLEPATYPLGRGEGEYALFLGRLVPCKGPLVALEAAERAGIPIRVGGGLHSADVTPEWTERLYASLRRPLVDHVGPVGGSRKLRLLRGARALLMPIEWEEPFGLVMIEAMMSGTPVIAFRRGAAPEVVEEGVTGFFADDAATMATTLRSIRNFDRAACRRRAVERFATERMVAGYERVYAAALRSERAASGGIHAE